ncbi:BPL-N domain-containing protein [Streptomyces sp. NPDC005438]|uniref:BPL-N domain-containing protein n=1 Tax=Streptomyces sp. NPDC005438 TaxID=3156880 RepID=UPI0033A7BF8D
MPWSTDRAPTRRTALRVGAVAVLAPAVGCAGEADAGRAGRAERVLVYRGPTSLEGCPESAAALLRRALPGARVAYCGPGESVPLTRAELARATLYVQPGGGDLAPAWRELRPYAPLLRSWVRGGGQYLGICLGGYLAGRPGLDLLPGRVERYLDAPDASVPDERDTVVAVRWRGRRRRMYFQDGPRFVLDTASDRSRVTVLARYDTGDPAALVAARGRGRVGVVGPHPEADAEWYRDEGLRNPEGVRFDLGVDLVRALRAGA